MTLRYVLLNVVVQFVWALGFLLIKVGLGQFPPIFLMAARFAIATAVLIWFVRPPFGMMRRIFVIVLLSATIPYSAIFTGLKYLDASTAILLIQTEVPFLAVFGAVLLGEKLGVRRVLGMALAFAGVALIIGQPRMQESVTPVVLIITGAISWGLGQTLIRKLGHVGGMRLLAWVGCFTFPQLLISSLIFETGQIEALLTVEWQDVALLGYLGLVMTAFGYSLWYKILATCEVNQVAPFILLNPVFVVIGGVWLLGDELSAITVAGGLLVVAGIAVVSIVRKQAQPA